MAYVSPSADGRPTVPVGDHGADVAGVQALTLQDADETTESHPDFDEIVDTFRGIDRGDP